jgi:tetratricopeptide (TPR) repeat protein
MNLNINFSRYLSIAILSFLLFSCKKYLDQKPLKTTVIPSSLADLQAILDRYDIMTQNGAGLLETIADNYYVTTNSWNNSPVNDRMNYIWDKNAMDYSSWYYPYTRPVYYSNVVIDQLNNITIQQSEIAQYNNIKGSALFHRAFVFYELAQLYCRPYSLSAETDPGIVLRTTSDINVPSVRATVKETYDQILKDLKLAAQLLPSSNLYPTRPNRAAALGEIARTYLSMRDYANAGVYADSFLQKATTLLNYNSLNANSYPVIPRFNTEIQFYHRLYESDLPLSFTPGLIDSALYQSYSTNDLRKKLFFLDNGNGTFSFKGSYEGGDDFWPFDGIVTDEMYLIRAECLARAGNKDAALSDLNTLLQTRWKTGTYVAYAAANAKDALDIILSERRKELLYRGLRWTDIRRLNLEGANIILKRVLNGTTYTLPPNDMRSVLLIPQEVLNLTSLQQNPR